MDEVVRIPFEYFRVIQSVVQVVTKEREVVRLIWNQYWIDVDRSNLKSQSNTITSFVARTFHSPATHCYAPEYLSDVR